MDDDAVRVATEIIARQQRKIDWIRQMFHLAVQIEEFVDDHQPGFVKCTLIDADSRRHEFIEKVPVVSTANLLPDSLFPQSGGLGCTIEKEWVDELGRCMVRVSTERPWSVESIAGEMAFTVLSRQISRP